MTYVDVGRPDAVTLAITPRSSYNTPMIFHQIDAGGDRNFAYLLADRPGGTAALVDPPPNSRRYIKLIEDDALDPAMRKRVRSPTMCSDF